MIWYLVIGITFTSVIFAEFGDKSQLMTISLSSRYENNKVFIGNFLGVGVVTLLAIALGSVIFQFISLIYIKIMASTIFIFFGLHILFFQNQKDLEIKDGERSPIFTSFLLSFLAEFGDKTQITIIALAGRFGSPLLVMIGALAGMATITGIGVFLGDKLGDIFENEKIDLMTSGIFIVLGTAFLMEALFFG